MKTALRTRLKGNTAAGSRVDWALRLQGSALPAIRLTKVRTPKDYHMGGAQNTEFHRVQVDCFAATYKAASELGDEVIALLEPGSGDFLGSFVLGDDDRQEDIESGPVHCRILEFRITYVIPA
jgi:hypothetical protein